MVDLPVVTLCFRVCERLQQPSLTLGIYRYFLGTLPQGRYQLQLQKLPVQRVFSI